MDITIITPAKIKSLSGNRATAVRWADFLGQLGHQLKIAVKYDGHRCDLMIALHAWRSSDAVELYKKLYPEHPLVVAMTGTDLYRFILSHPEPTLRSIQLADKLITLHHLAYKVLPESARQKIHVIHQSAAPLKSPRPESKPAKRCFDVCVVGHLREEKDSLRVAYAVRDLPQDSRIRVRHYGKAHNDDWAGYATSEMQINSRYRWFGEVKHWQIRQAYSRCQLMVLPSNMEGGANVISEGCVAGIPILASDIDGSIGLLGEEYAGYFPVGDTKALQSLLLKAESDTDFLNLLTKQCQQQSHLFTPQAEALGLKKLIDQLTL